MASLLDIFVSVKADASTLEPDLKKKLAKIDASRDGERVGGTFSTGFGGSMRKLAGMVGGIFAGVKVAQFGKDILNLSANAEQSVGAVESIFKGYAGTVQAQSEKANRALGLSGNSYRELASLIGSQLKNAGTSMDQLAPKTDQLITLGADLAAMFGGTTQDAVNALSSTLKGEFDPIERYGISLNQAKIQAEAMALGLVKAGQPLTDAAKQQAVLSLITKQSADAQGTFGREADTAAGRAQRAAAQWEDLKTVLGDQLLPVWSALMDFVGTKVLPGLNSLVFGFREGDVTSAGFAGTMERVGKNLRDVFDFVKNDVVPALSSMAGFIQKNSDFFIPFTAALVTGVAVFKTIVAVTKAWAAAQALLNVVLTANPIGLVIVAVAALVAGLVVAYKRSETFRDIVNGAFGAVADAGRFMWEKVLKPAWDALVGALSWSWGQFQKWRDIISGVMDGAKQLVLGAVRNIVNFYMWMAGGILNAAATAFGWVPGLGDKLRTAQTEFEKFKNGVNAALGGIQNKSVSVEVALGPGATKIARMNNLAVANGGIVDYFAAGGMRESHVAQIAPAGAWRVWAEPETGGESYIPLAPGKRGRSVDIWRETGRRLGVSFAEFASGGLNLQANLPGTAGLAAGIGALDNAAGKFTQDLAKRIGDRLAQEGPAPGGGYGFPPGGGSGANLIAFGRLMQSMGARVSEGPGPFGPVHRVHTRNSRHYCVPLDTLILTRRGWVTHDSVQVGDETIGYNPQTGRSEWTTVREVVHFDDAEVIEASHRQWSARFTPNHRWLAEKSDVMYDGYRYERAAGVVDGPCPDCGRPSKSLRSLSIHRNRAHGVKSTNPAPRKVGRGASKRRGRQAAELVEWANLRTNRRIRLAAPSAIEKGLPITCDEVAILAWAMTDGTITFASAARGRGHHRDEKRVCADIALYQKKRTYVDELDSLLADVPHTRVERHNRDGVTAWRLQRQVGTDLLAAADLFDRDWVKFVLALDSEQLAVFLRVCLAAEGCGTDEIAQSRAVNADKSDAIALAAFLCGYSPGVSPHLVSLRRPHVTRAKLRTRPAGRQPVWCVVTDLGSWTMRQDDEISLTGNSGRAIDVNYGPGGQSSTEMAFFDRIRSLGLAAKYGLRMLWRVPGHFNHAHFDYDAGGVASGVGMLMKNTPRPERVLSPEQTEAFDRLVAVLERGQGPSELVVRDVDGALVGRMRVEARQETAVALRTTTRNVRGA